MKTAVAAIADTAGRRRLIIDRPGASQREKRLRKRLDALRKNSPISDDELGDQLGLYLRYPMISNILVLGALYRRIIRIPGAIAELGCRYGRNLATFIALRELLEPYNPNRRIYGFDTFEGFPAVAERERGYKHAKKGGLACPESYQSHLDATLSCLEAASCLGHFRRSFTIAGDIRFTLPELLSEKPDERFALLYFDLDLEDVTIRSLELFATRLEPGAVIAFDNYSHRNWPGETLAVRKFGALRNARLRLLRLGGGVVYTVWT